MTEFGVSSCCLSLSGDLIVVGVVGGTQPVTLYPLPTPPEDQDRKSSVFGDAANKGKVFQVSEESNV